MKREDLIQKLAAEAKPVRLVRLGFLQFLGVFMVAILSIGAGAALVGLPWNIPVHFWSVRFLIESGLLLLLALLSTAQAFAFSIPGREWRLMSPLPMGVLGLWMVLGIYFWLRAPAPIAGWGFACVGDIVAMGIAPAIFIFILVRKAAPLRRLRVGWSIFLAAGAFGALGSQLVCHNTDPLHILVWHMIPTAVIACLGIMLGRKLLPRM
jgi:hypothetical protein